MRGGRTMGRFLYDMRKYVSWMGESDILTYCCCLSASKYVFVCCTSKFKLDNEYSWPSLPAVPLVGIISVHLK